ncbi:MAG: S8 family serine peptidase [Methanosarcinales archaeon]|nr:S8 family serine peptidase [Methanosarcinales archaeon]
MTQEYNVRIENDEQYYHVFLDVEDHAATDAMIKTLENFGVIIRKRYNDEITDFRVYLPLDNLTKVAELPFVTHIEYHDIPVEFELYMSKKMTGVDFVRKIDSKLKGSGVRLAVIDSGIDHHHPYLPTPVYELDVRDDIINGNYAEDMIGHGTHVIGIIANDDSAPSGYGGVAPDVELAVIKATGKPGPLGSVNQQIYDAIEYAVNDANAQVICISWCIRDNNKCIINSDGTTKWEQRADWAARNGAIFIKSAGNGGVTIDENGNIINRNYNSITCPGTAKNVISVGATNHWFAQEDDVSRDNTILGTQIDEVAAYSSRGDTGDDGHENGRNKPEVVAPGGACALTNDNNGGETASGVIISLSLNSPDGYSIEDYFTMDSGYEKTLLGIISPLGSSGSRSASWTLTAKDTIPLGTPLEFRISATYSNTGSTSDASLTIGGWRDEWFGENSDGGSAITTTESQDAIHHWLDDIPVKNHILSLMDIQKIIAASLS